MFIAYASQFSGKNPERDHANGGRRKGSKPPELLVTARNAKAAAAMARAYSVKECQLNTDEKEGTPLKKMLNVGISSSLPGTNGAVYPNSQFALEEGVDLYFTQTNRLYIGGHEDVLRRRRPG
ncbi:hypothetical protein EVAR_16354_1 [Eumeta japonica]|uniref:Uncharacterized protein n=1 Tax=Eumeta variegata TaxID=151549 RepID=A0A4C1VFN6_EUMVA|nr:hypothetical protein EVAR_16354_1 [Eumeta japonica]